MLTALMHTMRCRYLGKQGLTAPFSPTHDLDGMLAPPLPPLGLFISHVLHKVFCQVDESGAIALPVFPLLMQALTTFRRRV